ncbi:MAG: hypothetical protein Q9174_005234 [Haloplaca sp. 1 TL-2023]
MLAALLVCAVISSSLRFLDLTVSILSIRWITFFGLIYIRDDIFQGIFRAWWSISPPLLLSFSAVCFLSFTLFEIWRKGAPKQKEPPPCVARNEQEENDDVSKPLIFPSRTTHTRFFPKKHSFSYSYLLVGIPVGRRGVINSFLSADIDNDSPLEDAKPQAAWFQVDAADYLERGGGTLGLRGKLEQYLKSQVGYISSEIFPMLRTNV